MKYYTKSVEVEAEQFNGDPASITLVELKAHDDRFWYDLPGTSDYGHIRKGDWVVKGPDAIIVLTDEEFKKYTSEYDEVATLKEHHDRLLWQLGGVSTIALGHLTDGQYEGKPIPVLEEVLRLRNFVDRVIQIENEVLRPCDQMAHIENLIREFKNASGCSSSS